MNKTKRYALTCTLLLALILGSPLFAQMPADAVFSGFQPSGDFIFELDGTLLKNAEIYHSERAVAYLILAPELASPVLINPRTRSVERVHLMKVAKRENGTIDLLADASLDTLGSFEIDGREVVFSLGDKQARMKPKPWLLGSQSAQDLIDYSPEYGQMADAYPPRQQSLEALRGQQKQATVKVYFGSWCPACQRLVPKILRLEKEIDGSKIDFEYHGLPSPLSDDPETKRMNLKGVPTAVVLVDGKEVGRLVQDGWTAPEVTLAQILKEAS